MRKEGFVPVKAVQGRSRIEGKAEYTKHMLRFRREEDEGIKELGDSFPEVVLLNAHDGTSSYRLMAGVFRMVCLNGMVVREENHGSIRVPHKGDVVGMVIDGSYEVLDHSRRSIGVAKEWSDIRLSDEEQRIMARAAHAVRFEDAHGKVETAIRPEQLLEPRRKDDNGNDLWKTFNRVQENAIRGGLSATWTDSDGRRRVTTTREVRSIDNDVRLNRALWRLTEEMAALKRRDQAA
jgi:hypothetical protein